MQSVIKIAACGLAIAILSGCNMSMQGNVEEPDLEVQQVDRLAALNTRLGIGYLREGRNELAYTKLTRALQIQPEYSGAHNAIALLYEQLGQHGKSEKHYRTALEYAPQDSKARNNYGGFLCRRERVDDALVQFEAAMTNPLYDSPGSAMTNAGLCMYRAKRYAKAEDYLRRALTLLPREPSALLAMSELSIANGRELSARGYLQRFLERAKHNQQSLWLGVRIERVLGDNNALSSYTMLLRANYPDARETKLLLQSQAK